MQLEQHQVFDLAKPFVTMIDELTKFYDEPANKKAFAEWYKVKYGTSPESEVKI